jgi:16S rRNA (cytidine1402-2'-O)-methyltransferase
MSELISGTLFIVATPIGNLEDITFRAVKVLKEASLIAAEDTRHSKKLLQHYGINTKVISLHNYNESKRSELLLQHLLQGESLALISDAGTPLISDPGYLLVQKARESNIKVVPIPGPSALITALCASGLPTDKFIFEGFLPVKIEALRQKLLELKSEKRTLIIYEAPHRISKLINAMIEILGEDRSVVIARELTKMFETIRGGSLKDIKIWLESGSNQQKGEFVVLVRGILEDKKAITSNVERILSILLPVLTTKKTVEITAKITGANKNEVYKLALAMQKCK